MGSGGAMGNSDQGLPWAAASAAADEKLRGLRLDDAIALLSAKDLEMTLLVLVVTPPCADATAARVATDATLPDDAADTARRERAAAARWRIMVGS